MDLQEKILRELEEIENEDDYPKLIQSYLNQVNQSPDLYEDLLNISQVIASRGYRVVELMILEGLFKLKPSNKVAYLIAEVFYQFEHYTMAYKWIKKVNEKEPTYKKQLLEAKINLKIGNTNIAVKELKTLVKEFHKNAEAYLLLAEYYVELNDLEQAERYYQAVFDYLLQYPHRIDLRQRLVEIELQKEIISITRIESLFDKETGVPPRDAYDYFLLALAYQNAGKLDEAIKYAKQSLDKDIDFLDAELLLVDIYQEKGMDYSLKRSLNRLAKALPSDHPMIVEIAQKLSFLGNYSDEFVEKLLSSFILLTDEEDKFKLIHLIVEDQLSKSEGAQALHYLKVYGLSEFDEDQLSYLFAKTYELLNMTDRVEEYYKVAVETLVPNQNLIVDFAKFYMSQGKNAEAYELTNEFHLSIYDTKELQKIHKNLKKSL